MNCHKLNTNYRKVNTMHYITDPTPGPGASPLSPLQRARGILGAGNCGCDRTAVPICSAWAGIRRDATWGQFHAPVGGLWACLHSLGVVGLTTYDLRITWNVPLIKGRG